MSTLKEMIEQARAVGTPEDINFANAVDSFLTDADATVRIGTKLHELINGGRLKEYAALKRLAGDESPSINVLQNPPSGVSCILSFDFSTGGNKICSKF